MLATRAVTLALEEKALCEPAETIAAKAINNVLRVIVMLKDFPRSILHPCNHHGSSRQTFFWLGTTKPVWTISTHMPGLIRLNVTFVHYGSEIGMTHPKLNLDFVSLPVVRLNQNNQRLYLGWEMGFHFDRMNAPLPDGSGWGQIVMPEKNLNEVTSRARDFHERGNSALQKHNFDYAVEMFDEALRVEPGFYECREALRAAQFKKAEGSTGGMFKKMFGMAGQSPLFAKVQLALRANPTEAVHLAEQILRNDPANVTAHKLLAEAALALDLPRTAILSLEIALKHAPDDRALAMKLAETLSAHGQVSRAEHIYAEILRASPNDPKVSQALKNVTAQRTMTEGGFEVIAGGTGSYRDILKDKAGAVALEQGNRGMKSDDLMDRLIIEHEARLQHEPANLALLRTLAELHSKRHRFDRAIECYQKVQSLESGGDPAVEKAIADTRVKQLEHRLEQLDPTDPNLAAERKRLVMEKLNFQLQECQRRAERYPHDLLICHELGQLYFQADRLGEAIREFQRAMNNPHKRVAAMNFLGQCFLRRGMHDLAVRRFQEAIKEKPIFDDERKELVYWLGTVFEKMGRRDEALEQFKQIYEVDIGYRDVSDKVDAYYQSDKTS